MDKIGADFRGDPSSALLEVLDPEQNNSFSDHYLDVGFDLSKVMFITTANLLDPIPPPLRDRMEVLELPGYTEEEKVGIAFNYLIPRQLEAHGLTAGAVLEIEPEAIRARHRLLHPGGGLAQSGAGDRRASAGAPAREIAEGTRERVAITEEDLATYLGPPKFFREAALEHPEPGVATGLAWTPTGGDILFIEALRMPGNGDLKLTGQLGDVMKESAAAAHELYPGPGPFPGRRGGLLRRHRPPHPRARRAPSPRTGPPPGWPCCCALVSLLSGRPVKKGLAMTGEITLRGHVLPVGGHQEQGAGGAPGRASRKSSCRRKTRWTWKRSRRACARN